MSSCPPFGACKSFLNASLGANSLHSNSFRSKKAGFGGTCMPLTAVRGGTLFLYKYLMICTPIQHRQHFFCWVNITYRHLDVFLLVLQQKTELCLYHNRSQQQHTLTGPFFTIVWNVEIKSLKQFACLCWVSLHILFVHLHQLYSSLEANGCFAHNA